MYTTLIAIPYTKTYDLKSIMYRLLYIPYGPLKCENKCCVKQRQGT